jgi:DNA-binding transcriptional LysR family regulator
MFNLNQLNHFRLVAETGNFATAARRAHITQPALSNSIRTLEDRIGVQLFDRSQRPVRVTSAGRDLLSRIDSLLKEARNLEKEFGNLAQGLTGKLCIGMTAQSSASIGGAILGRWLLDNSKMSADITVADTLLLMEGLRAEKFDLIIADDRDLPTNTREFDMTPLRPEQGHAFCRAGHPLLDLPSISFSDLLPYRFAGAHFPKSVMQHLCDIFSLKDHNIIELAIESDHIAVLRDATIHSDIILLTTSRCLRNELTANLIVKLPIDLDTFATWHTVTLKNTVAHPAITSLKKAIANVTQET